jgi:chromate transport protein ChrA
METLSKFTLPGILFALTLAFGFGLSHAGKPYNGLLFNAHKLIALGAVVLAVLRLASIPRPFDSFALIAGLLVIAAVCVIALFVSGALMSAGKLDYAVMLTIHRVAPGMLAICCALVLYLLVRKP